MARVLTFNCLALFLTLLQVVCFGQQVIIASRHEIAINGGFSMPIGDKDLGTTPALFANMNPGYTAELRFTTTLLKHIQVGAWLGGANYSGWSSIVSPKLFRGTSMSFLSAGPAIGYTTSHYVLTRRKFGFCAWIQPGVSKITVETSDEADINDDTSKETLRLESTRFTMGLNAGVSYVCNMRLGMRLLVGYRYTAADSKVFNDASYSAINAGVGIFYRMHLDRRFKYSHL